MNPKKLILQFIQKAYKNIPRSDASEDNDRSEKHASQNEIIHELFDGMSTGTARIIIEQEVSRVIQEKFNIDLLKNKGRYYTAKIVRSDGSTIQRLLIDKQTGGVQMIGH